MPTINPLRRYITAIRRLRAAEQDIERLIPTLTDGIPSPTLADALWAYHCCQQEAEDAWQQLSKVQRSVLQPPTYYNPRP